MWEVSFTPRPLYPGERPPNTHWIGGWVGSRAGLDAVVKRKIPSSCRESNTSRPVPSLITISLFLNILEDMEELSYWELLRTLAPSLQLHVVLTRSSTNRSLCVQQKAHIKGGAGGGGAVTCLSEQPGGTHPNLRDTHFTPLSLGEARGIGANVYY